MPRKVFFKIAMDRVVHDELWKRVVELASREGGKIHGLFTRLVEEALTTYVNKYRDSNEVLDKPELLRDKVSVTLFIDPELVREFIKTALKRYRKKHGAKTAEFSRAIREYLGV